MGSVAVLAVTGTIQAWREVGTLDALTTTSYGLLVVAKVSLFAALVALGYFARRTVLRRSAGSATVTKLRRSVLTEVMIGAVVLAITAVLIAQPPGKVSLAANRAKPKVATVALSAGSSATIDISPGVHGQVRVAVRLTGTSSTARLTASASLPAKQLGPIPIDLKAAGPQNYTATDLVLPAAGTWVISLVVQGSEFDSTTAVARLRIS
jgi:copper transport protein